MDLLRTIEEKTPSKYYHKSDQIIH